MRAKITKRNVDQLTAGQSIADSEVRGFRVRRLDSGVIVYEFRYSRNGRRPCINLGHHGSITPDQARALAKKRAGEAALGLDPAEQRHIAKRAARSTVDAVLNEFVARHVKNLRGAHEVERCFDVYVRPRIGAKSVYDLRRRDIVELLDAIEDNGAPVMADRVLAHLRKALNWKAARDESFNSPIVKGMARTKPKERARDRILDDQELRDLWTALDNLGEAAPACFPSFVRVLFLTATRRRMVSDMTFDEVDGRGWTVPGTRNKGARDHFVPLTETVLALLGPKRPGFLFSTDGGKTAFSGFSKSKAALDRKLREIRKAAGRKPMAPWVLHDLRRTARSLMSKAGVPADFAERAIGHVIGGVRGVYDRYAFADEKRDALERLGALVERILHPDDKVVSFRHKQR
jgi:integrase